MPAASTSTITGLPSHKSDAISSRKTVEKVLGKRKRGPSGPNPLSVKKKKAKKSTGLPVGTTKELLPLRQSASKKRVAEKVEAGEATKRKKRNRGKKKSTVSAVAAAET